MSFKTVHRSSMDAALYGRVTACVAKEQDARGEVVSPDSVTSELYWGVISAGDVEGAYASALANNNPDPGGDESVITDGMILSAVQAN